MTYATQADLVARYGEVELIQLTDPEQAAVDVDIVAQALADVDALIDGHLAGRYTVPLTPAPPILVSYACDLARARLYKDALPEHLKNRADDALKFLRAVGEGRLALGVQPEPTSDNVVQFATGQKVFAREAI